MTQKAAAVSGARFPVRLTSFIGRVAELRSVSDTLGRQRLVSLVGPGGSGKTRLALEAARGWAGRQRWFVDLAPVGSDGVDAALAVAADAPEGPGEAPLDAAVRRIGEADALLVLDNCDPVVGPCARAVDVLLRACPGLTVLSTSREPLRVEGELVWRVPPLSLPSNGESLDGDAVLLFLDRASLSTDAATRDLEHIHQICRCLDGMPLAIELAASRARVLPVADILSGLSDRFRLLTGGPRTADMRQQSLAESIDWSYRLLADDERTVLQRLSAFRAPFTAAGTRAVATGRGVDEHDVLALLANLVEKSFVVIDEQPDAGRYRLLETIREYAGSQLAAEPEEAHTARTRHLRYVRDAAERVESVLEGGASSAEWPGRFEVELPDVRAAVNWSAEIGIADDALRVVGALAWFWYFRARAEDRRIIDTALAIAGGDTRGRAKALTAAGVAAMAGLDPQAIWFGQEAVRIATESGDRGATARALARLGWCYVFVDHAQARPCLLQACELARANGDQWCLADALTALMSSEYGQLPAARARGEEALAIAVAEGYELTACHARNQLTIVSLFQGSLDEAIETGTKALRTAEALGERPVITFMRNILAGVAVFRGDLSAAEKHTEAAVAMTTASGNPLHVGIATLTSGMCSYAKGHLGQARIALAEGLPIFSLMVGGLFAPVFAGFLADADLQAGDIEAAREHTLQLAALAEQADTEWGRSRAAVAQCRIDLHDGEVQAAAEAAQRALQLARINEDAITTIDALELLARIAAERNTPELAARLLAGAAAERERIGYARFRVHAAAHGALVHDLERQLGAEAFTTAWAEGERLTVDEAMALARSRRGSRGRPATGWDALTPAELRVVALVGEGLNNIQVAERLFVTRDTVKGHVSAAFRKLGVSNRAELAAEAARRFP